MSYDPVLLEKVSKQFRREMWRSAAMEAIGGSGIEEKRFGPVQATAVRGETLPWLKPWVDVRFSRHAKNEMRLYEISSADVQAAAGSPIRVESDESGNWRLSGFDTRGRAIIVVIAHDDANFVITTFPDN